MAAGAGSPDSHSRPPASTPGIADPPLPFSGGRIPDSAAERRLVERRVMAQFFVAPGLSLAALAGGFNLGWPRLAAGGVIGLGLSALAVAWFAIRERRLMFIRGGSMTQRAYRYFIYEGCAAIPYGLAFAVAGLALGTCGLLYLADATPAAMRDAVLAKPHLALLPVGAALVFYGLGFTIGFRRAAVSAGDRVAIALTHLPAQLGGLILCALGAAALALGLTEWLAPSMFRQQFQSFFGNPWPFDGGRVIH